MGLRCKPGDLAIVVKSMAGNEGKVVRCIKFLGKVDGIIGNDCWEIDTELLTTLGMKSRTHRDKFLRPIRDQPGADESLTWAPVPKTKRLTEEEFKAVEVKWGETPA